MSETERTTPAPQSATRLPSCPGWCTLPAGHELTLEDDDGTEARYHLGPAFGAVTTSALEVTGEPLRPATALLNDVDGWDLAAGAATELALSLLAAAAWVERVNGGEA